MASKYPRLAFNARDVQDLLTVIRENAKDVCVVIKPAQTQKDPNRLIVAVSCYRRQMLDGKPLRVEGVRYVSGLTQETLDRATFDACWKVVNELEAPAALWGTYTQLFEGFPASTEK